MLIAFLRYSIASVQHFLFDKIIIVREDVMLPNSEWWGELFEFCPNFTTWKLWLF